VVLGVASIPALFLWLFIPDEAVTALEPVVEVRAELPPRAEEVTFASGVTSLSGVIHMPGGAGPHPGVVVVHGSGRQTAHGLAPIGEAFARAGIAALTYDKRGVGRSQGTYATVSPGSSDRTLGTLAGDALAGVAFLKAQRDIRWTRIGLVGLSQGGWIAPLAASQTSDVAFMVLYSGPTVSVGEEIYFSDLTGEQGGSTERTDPEIARLLATYDGPRGFDPRPVLRDLDVPGLWLLGERDRSIPVPETTAILGELQADGRPFAYEVFPGADHSLRDETGSLVDSWPVVADWLNRIGVLED